MKFKAAINLQPVKNPPLSKKYTLTFTRSQIIFPKTASGLVYMDSDIRDGARYKLHISDNIKRSFRYQIQINDGKLIRLGINSINEIKLKWIHDLYLVKREPLASIAILISILALVVSIVKK